MDGNPSSGNSYLSKLKRVKQPRDSTDKFRIELGLQPQNSQRKFNGVILAVHIDGLNALLIASLIGDMI